MTRSTLARLVAASLGLAAAAAAQPQLLVPLTPPAPTPAASSAMKGREEPSPAEQAALAFRSSRVQGQQLHKAVRKVNRELKWFDDLAVAQKAAKATGRPIVWFQVLGDRKGFT